MYVYVWLENSVCMWLHLFGALRPLPEVLHINFQLVAATSKRVRVPVRFSCFPCKIGSEFSFLSPMLLECSFWVLAASMCKWVRLYVCVCSLCNVVWAGKVVWSFSLDLVAKMATGWQKGTRQQQRWRRRRRRVKNKHLHYVSRRNWEKVEVAAAAGHNIQIDATQWKHTHTHTYFSISQHNMVNRMCLVLNLNSGLYAILIASFRCLCCLSNPSILQWVALK